jgi:hypothetical protein
MGVGVLALLHFAWKRHDEWGEWPSFTDCLVVWGIVFAVFQAPLTAIAILAALGSNITFDAIGLIGYGLISGFGLAIQELRNKYKGK